MADYTSAMQLGAWTAVPILGLDRNLLGLFRCLLDSANALSPLVRHYSPLASVRVLRLDSRHAKVQTRHHLGCHFGSGVRDLVRVVASSSLGLHGERE